MSENSQNLAASPVSRRPIGWAVGLAVLLLPVGVGVAILGVVMGLLVFNGCFGASSPVGEILGSLWIFVFWPLAVLGTALVPPILLGAGRGRRAALSAFVIGCLVSLFIWVAWLGVGYFSFC